MFAEVWNENQKSISGNVLVRTLQPNSHMDQKENLLSALSAHDIKIESIQGNYIYTQDEFCVEIKGDGKYKLSQGGFQKNVYKNLDKLSEAIKQN